MSASKVLPADAPQPAFAIAELSKYMGTITGTDTPIANSKAAGVIAIGMRPDLSDADQAALPPPAGGFDGYAIAVLPGKDPSAPRIVIGAEARPSPGIFVFST